VIVYIVASTHVKQKVLVGSLTAIACVGATPTDCNTEGHWVKPLALFLRHGLNRLHPIMKDATHHQISERGSEGSLNRLTVSLPPTACPNL
jgi:hypothetical protein